MVTFGVAYNAISWSTFLSAQLGAAAALTGLLFVAVSINLSRILSFPHLTARVAKGLITLLSVLFAATLCLVPGQSVFALGIELASLGTLVCFAILALQRRASLGNLFISRGQKLFQALLTGASGLPLIVCGVSLLIGRGGGLYWLVAAVLLCFVSALVDAWVLLIEIQR